VGGWVTVFVYRWRAKRQETPQNRQLQPMAVSVKHFLLLILFAGFALAALLNSERAVMLETVKLVTFVTLVLMAYGVWASAGEQRAYCAGFVLWGGLYYLLFVVIQTQRIDLGTDHLLLWLAHRLDRLTQRQMIIAVYEKTGHLLLSILFGLIGGWVTVYFYRKRQRMLNRTK
jgi:hypothetical protein